jgi:hypothetical protein
VAEQNATKGASPTGVLRSLAAYWRRTVTVLLGAVLPYIYYLLNCNKIPKYKITILIGVTIFNKIIFILLMPSSYNVQFINHIMMPIINIMHNIIFPFITGNQTLNPFDKGIEKYFKISSMPLYHTEFINDFIAMNIKITYATAKIIVGNKYIIYFFEYNILFFLAILFNKITIPNIHFINVYKYITNKK